MVKHATLLIVLLTSSAAAAASENLLINADFEQGLSGWNELWTRTPGGKAALDAARQHGSRHAARIEHTGSQDWSFQQQKPLQVTPGRIYRLSGWLWVEGEGSATLCVTLRDADDKVTDWAFGAATARASGGWRRLHSRFIIPPGTKTMLPRLIGHGPAKVWLDDAVLSLSGTLDELRSKDLPETLKTANASLEVTLQTADATLSVVDRRTGRQWIQRPAASMLVLDAEAVDGGFKLQLLEPAMMLRITGTIRLDDKRPELAVELAAQGEMGNTLAFPHPFLSGEGTFLVMPVNEGISYPVDDRSLPPMRYHLYGGHGLCMPWYGVTDGERADDDRRDRGRRGRSGAPPRRRAVPCPRVAAAKRRVRPHAAAPLRLLRPRRLRGHGEALP